MTDTFKPGFGIRAYSYRVRVPALDLARLFAMQQWCQAVLDDRWAASPPGSDSQDWFFEVEADATLFRLRWL